MNEFILYCRTYRLDSYTKVQFETLEELMTEVAYKIANGWEVVINPKGNLHN